MNAAADQFVEVLAAAGVARIYGIVGDSLTDAIRRQGSPRHNSRTTSFAGPAGVRGPSGQPSLGVSSPDLGPRLIAGACFPGNHRRRPKTLTSLEVGMRTVCVIGNRLCPIRHQK
jgi:hypothetical protein